MGKAPPKDEDFNSSDIEVPEAEPDRFSRAGQQSIESMLESAIKDRAESKIKLRQQKYTALSPASQYFFALWSNRFKAFRESTLRCAPDAIPTADQFIRFLYAIPDHVKAMGSEAIVSHSTVRGCVHFLTEWALFTFPDFTLAARDRKRIASTLHKLLQSNKITRNPSRGDKLWITTSLVQRMITALYRQAIYWGTDNWDIVIMRALAILLTSATAGRAGDITRSQFYSNQDCLCWKDVVIRLRPGTDRFICTITLRFCKGEKNQPRYNKAFEFEELSDPSLGPACLVKLLIAWGLRTEAIRSRSIAHLRTELAPNRRIWFTRADDPILCSIKIGQSIVDFKRSAGNHTIVRALRETCVLIGIMARPVAHDLRRGAAYEQASMPAPQSNIEGVRSLLGHSFSTAYAGTTDEYVGHSGEDNWAQRLANPAPIRAKHVIDTTDVPGPIKRRRTSTEITETCVSMGLDPNDPRKRQLAGVRAREQKLQAWRDEQAARITNGDQDAQINDDNNAPAAAATTSSNQDPEGHDAREPPLDPRMQALYNSLITGRDSDVTHQESALASLMDDMSGDEAMTSAAGNDDSGGSAPPQTFRFDDEGDVRRYVYAQDRDVTCLSSTNIDALPQFLSKVNVYLLKLSGQRDDLPQNVAVGGTRDPPSRIWFYCPHDGCDFKSGAYQMGMNHAAVCRVHRDRDLPFACDNCDYRYDTRRKLHAHRRRCLFTPRRCARPGYSDTTIFGTYREHADHVQLAHTGWVNRCCMVQTCKRASRPFSYLASMKHHIMHMHPEIDQDTMKNWLFSSSDTTASTRADA